VIVTWKEGVKEGRKGRVRPLSLFQPASRLHHALLRTNQKAHIAHPLLPPHLSLPFLPSAPPQALPTGVRDAYQTEDSRLQLLKLRAPSCR